MRPGSVDERVARVEYRRQSYTFDAHRLVHWAGVEGSQLSLKLALLRAYRSESKDPGDHEVLVEAAQSVGLDAAEACDVLRSEDYADEVRAEERQYQAVGIQSVPAIIFNHRYLVTGCLSCAPNLYRRIRLMKKTRISIILFVLAVLSPLAHASLAAGAHEFKNDAKTAGKNSGHAVRDGVHAVGRGAKTAGHAVADATRHGYHSTKKFVTGHG